MQSPQAPNPGTSTLLHETGLIAHAPNARRAYFRLIATQTCKWDLHQYFMFMSIGSGQNNGRPVLCQHFLPAVHLYLMGYWCKDDGIDCLLADWQRLEQFMHAWLTKPDSISAHDRGVVYLSRGHALLVMSRLPDLEHALALEIVREHG